MNPEQPTTWVTAQDGHKSCPDCEKLAGKTMPLKDWVASGLMPGNGNTICQDSCLCALVPSKWAKSAGDVKVVDISLPKINKLELLADKFLPTDNHLYRWQALMEREAGVSADPAEDMRRSLEMFFKDPDGLKKNYPRRYKLISELIK